MKFDSLNDKHKQILFYALTLLSGGLFVGLIIFAYLGTFSRYGADDYCFSYTLYKSQNLLDATRVWYLGSSNRYTTMLFVGISEWFGHSAIQYLPALVIILWLAALTWTLSRLTTRLRIPHPFSTGLMLALTIVFFSILQAPNRYQSLYWRSAMVTYFVPLIFFSFLSGVILVEIWNETQTARARWIALGIVVLGFFLAGGLSETTLAIQGGALGLAILGTILFVRGPQLKRALSLLIPALLASILALIVVFLAPANSLRAVSFGPPPPILEVFRQSLIFAWDFIRESVKSEPLPTLVAMIIGLLSGVALYGEDTPFAKSSLLVSSLIVIPLSVYVLIFFSMAPTMYGQQTYTGARALMASRAVMVTGLLFSSFLMGLWLQMRLDHASVYPKLLMQIKMAVILLLALSVIYPLYASKNVLGLVPVYSQRAVQWDERDAFIRQEVGQGVKDLSVIQLNSTGGVLEYKGDPISWVNACAAEYYGLDSLIAP